MRETKGNYRKKRLLKTPVLLLTIMLLSVIIIVSTESYRLYISDKLNSDNSLLIPTISNNNSSTTMPKKINKSDAIPSEAMISVPFTTQAPFANWDAVHEEACEEASLIMIKHFIKKDPIASPNSAEQEILSLIDYENNHGYKVDVTLQELATIAKDFYGLSGGRAMKNITVDDMKREIAAGKPIIIPASGKLLDNPNFKDGGPLYHMMVVKGYDSNGFITNDPGTRKGEGFRYTFDNLFNAIHNWNPSDINQGEKGYLVFD